MKALILRRGSALTSGVGVPTLPLILLVLLPKCPACLGAYLGFVAVLGLGMGQVAWWLKGGLMTAIALLLWRWGRGAASTREWRPFALGLTGFGAIVANRLLAGPMWVGWLGVLTFVGGAWWCILAPVRTAGRCPRMHGVTKRSDTSAGHRLDGPRRTDCPCHPLEPAPRFPDGRLPTTPSLRDSS